MLRIAKKRDWLARFKPMRTSLSFRERASAGVGGLLGLFLTGFIADAWLGASEQVPLLIAPMGASTVLVFGVPASPLAQPWSVVGGNTIAALIGVGVALSVGDPVAAGAVAVALTIVVTSLLGCLHPPAGAVALTAVIGGPLIAAQGFRFALVPVALNSGLLVLLGVVFNSLMGRSYPHVPVLPDTVHHTADAPPEFRLGFSAQDITKALERRGSVLDVERDDILALFREVEEAAHQRLRGIIRCADIMSRDLVTVGPDDAAAVALERLHAHGLRVLPVVDETGHVLTAVDLATVTHAPLSMSVRHLPPVHFELVSQASGIEELLPRLSQGHVQEALIVDDDARLVGVVTQTDLLAVLGRARLANATTPSELARALRALRALPALPASGSGQGGRTPSRRYIE